jgi:hypothetical protein
MKKPIIKKAQTGKSVKPTADSTDYFVKKATKDINYGTKVMKDKGYFKDGKVNDETKKALDLGDKSLESLKRQAKKGKPGYDANGFPLKKKMQDGGPVFKGDPKSDKKILRKVKKFIKSPVAKNPAFEAELAKRKPKMQAGGVVKTQPRRVGPVDPNGPYTMVQERTLRGDKVAAPKLVKDKELGATKMKKGGKVSKKK